MCVREADTHRGSERDRQSEKECEWVKLMTWTRESVEITNDRSEGCPERWLIVHAAVDQVGQFCPLGNRQMMAVLIEQVFLWVEWCVLFLLQKVQRKGTLTWMQKTYILQDVLFSPLWFLWWNWHLFYLNNWFKTINNWLLFVYMLQGQWKNWKVFFLTLELSMFASGFSPPLQISQSVVPKLHLSVARLRFLGSMIHSGGTHGIRSTKTEIRKIRLELTCLSR